MSDKQARKYFENMPYGDDAKSSEIHGKANQQVINDIVEGLVSKYDEAMMVGNKDLASKYNSVIKQISKDLDNLREIKKEFAVNYGGGTGGKNMFSNYTNLKQFDIPFWLESGRITFDEGLKPILSVPDSNNPNQEISKRIEDITENWVVKGSEEADFMRMQQDAVKQRNTVGKPLDFDVDFAIDNLLVNNDAWKIFVSDKIGGRYFLQDYIIENENKMKSGEIKDNMLHPDSFNPDLDTRLHKYYSTRIYKAFDPDYLTPEEVIEAKQLESKVGDLKTLIPSEDTEFVSDKGEETIDEAIKERFKKS
tara:strand:+ start:285 stop:1208 length:924 start_codon:yes stop_codon:yes gene_type:complete